MMAAVAAAVAALLQAQPYRKQHQNKYRQLLKLQAAARCACSHGRQQRSRRDQVSDHAQPKHLDTDPTVQLRADAYVAVVLDIVLSVFSWLAASCSSVPVPGQDGTYRASDICVWCCCATVAGRAGEKGVGKMGKPLHFKGSSFHRVIPQFM